MTESELLTAAKLREQLRNKIEGDSRLYKHTAITSDPEKLAALSYVESVMEEQYSIAFAKTNLGKIVHRKLATDEATKALVEENADVLSFFVGITDMNIQANNLEFAMMMNERIENNDAPAYLSIIGKPNTGKTTTAVLLYELRRSALPELKIVSNIREPWVDDVVTSSYDLAIALLEDRERPKCVLIDEGSTHFDARTKRREIATQYTPLAKRFAKLGVDYCAIIGHTGKDLHPEVKRLTTLAIVKSKKTEGEIYEYWAADDEKPTDKLIEFQDLEKSRLEIDPDDAAPWKWNLEADIFAEDLEWNELLTELKKIGPAD